MIIYNFLIDSSFVELSLSNSFIFQVKFQTSKKKLVQVKFEF